MNFAIWTIYTSVHSHNESQLGWKHQRRDLASRSTHFVDTNGPISTGTWTGDVPPIKSFVSKNECDYEIVGIQLVCLPAVCNHSHDNSARPGHQPRCGQGKPNSTKIKRKDKCWWNNSKWTEQTDLNLHILSPQPLSGKCLSCHKF